MRKLYDSATDAFVVRQVLRWDLVKIIYGSDLPPVEKLILLKNVVNTAVIGGVRGVISKLLPVAVKNELKKLQTR